MKKNQLFTHMQDNSRCEICKTTLQYVLKVGRLGCPECYKAFRHILVQLIPQMQQVHVGKRPTGNKIRVLEDMMVKAALGGQYEDAFQFRNQIKELKK